LEAGLPSYSPFPPRAEGAEPKRGLIQPVTSVSHYEVTAYSELSLTPLIEAAVSSLARLSKEKNVVSA